MALTTGTTALTKTRSRPENLSQMASRSLTSSHLPQGEPENARARLLDDRLAKPSFMKVYED